MFLASRKDPSWGSFLLFPKKLLMSIQEQIQQFTQQAVNNKKTALAMLIGLFAITVGLVAMNADSEDMLAAVGATRARIVPEIEIVTVGATNTVEVVATDGSWPGELLSLGNVFVQPSREGTIASWNVHIGQKVSAGQTLGTLSRPPAMPDTVAMLAEKAGEATMSRANVDAKRAYVAERVKQLLLLRENTERSLRASRDLLGTGTNNNSELSMVSAKKEAVRAVLRGTLAKTYPVFSGSITLPTKWSSITLTSPIGVQNSRLRDQFQSILFAVKTDLDTPEQSPVASGLAYFDLSIKLADASLPDGTTLTDATLMELKSTLHEDQESFIMAVDKLREAELMAVDTEKMSFEQLRMFDSEIAMLRQDLAMAEGDVTAKEASYNTVRAATEDASVIVAPESGMVSSILKKPGEFVEPGMPVAVVTSTKNTANFVRVRLPNNIKTPEIGETLLVVRTGFYEDAREARLIGIGNALDESGSVMADAILLEPTDWPIGASLRILVPESVNTVRVGLSSLWWDAEGKPNVWALSDAGRVYAKRLTLGRTVGTDVEVYSGLVRGDRYIVKPPQGITEDMLLDDVSTAEAKEDVSPESATPNPHAGHAGMEGMEM